MPSLYKFVAQEYPRILYIRIYTKAYTRHTNAPCAHHFAPCVHQRNSAAIHRDLCVRESMYADLCVRVCRHRQDAHTVAAQLAFFFFTTHKPPTTSASTNVCERQCGLSSPRACDRRKSSRNQTNTHAPRALILGTLFALLLLLGVSHSLRMFLFRRKYARASIIIARRARAFIHICLCRGGGVQKGREIIAHFWRSKNYEFDVLRSIKCMKCI